MRSMLNRGGNATAAPKMNHKLSSFSFTGALQILSPPSPKSENSEEVINKIEIVEKSNEDDEIIAKKRISSLVATVEAEYRGQASKR